MGPITSWFAENISAISALLVAFIGVTVLAVAIGTGKVLLAPMATRLATELETCITQREDARVELARCQGTRNGTPPGESGAPLSGAPLSGAPLSGAPLSGAPPGPPVPRPPVPGPH